VKYYPILSREKLKSEFLLHILQTGSGVHPTFYPMGTGASFPGDKVAGV
jgi:hypothetical protein